MIEISVTEDMVEKAKKKARRHGDIKNSIRRGAGNLSGYLGEEIVLASISDCVEHNTRDYDIIRFKGTDFEYTIDVKTKERTVEPQEIYTCHVALTSAHQNVDVYIFCQTIIKRSPKRAWILGWMNKDEYMAKAKLMMKGDLDDFGWENKADGFVLPISDLNSVSDI